MISVVLPCYNRGALLARAIDSVLAQGAHAGQVIVVDDGSTDDTKDICARYGNRIEYVWQKNAGPSVARNIGVKHARNQWVAFLDSDDYWTPFHLARMAKAIEQTDGEARFYFSDMQMGEDNNCITLWQTINFVPPHPVHLTKDGTNWVFLRRQPTMLQCSVFRRDAWMESGGLDPRFRLKHDSELFYRLGIGGKICAVSGVGCVQTEDDVSKVRLTTAVHPHDAAYWEESIMLLRSLLRGSPNLSPTYRRIARLKLASSYWRLIRLYWSSGNLGKGVRHLPMLGWTDPFFVISLLAYRRGCSDANRPAVLPEYD
jgi:glycosyltransferase involved in cell wall biosynthesis